MYLFILFLAVGVITSMIIGIISNFHWIANILGMPILGFIFGGFAYLLFALLVTGIAGDNCDVDITTYYTDSIYLSRSDDEIDIMAYINDSTTLEMSSITFHRFDTTYKDSCKIVAEKKSFNDDKWVLHTSPTKYDLYINKNYKFNLIEDDK